MLALIKIPHPPKKRVLGLFAAKSEREAVLEQSPLEGVMLCTLPGLVHSPLHRRRIWRRLAASMRSADCAHYLCGCGRIDYLEAEGYSCPQESEEYFLLRANEASLLLLDRLRLPPDQISVLLNSDDVGVREELLLTAFSRRSAWLLLRANDAQAAASLAEDFYYEQGIALVADAQLSIPSPCFIYSAGAHAWLGQSGAALRRDTVMYIRGRDCGLPGLYADGFDVLLPYWLEKWRPANCSTGSFAAMLYQATGNRRLLTLRITGFTQAGRPVYAAPGSLLRAQTG